MNISILYNSLISGKDILYLACTSQNLNLFVDSNKYNDKEV